MKTQVSVIIPVYNTEEWLRECLDSVVNQTVPFDEVILVNDGSTDSSLDICKFYINKFEYLKLISQENKGLSVARNTGLQHVFGDYVMFLDSDDYLKKDAVKTLKERLEEGQYDAVFFDADIHNMYTGYQVGKNIYDRKNSGLDGKMWNGWEYFSRCYPRDYVVSACMAVYRKKVIDDAKLLFPEGVYYEDNYFSFLFLKHAKAVTHISEKLYQRRYRENSLMTSLFSEKKFTDFIKVCRLIWTEKCKNVEENFLKYKSLLLSFCSDNYIRILNNYQTCLTQNITLCSQSIDLFCKITEDYLNIFQKMELDIAKLDLSDLCRIAYIFHYMKAWNLIKETKPVFPIEKITELQKSQYIDMLSKLPFDRKESTIGIYGTGKHTEGMLVIYERLIGKIQSNLVFIDTRKDNETYKGRKLINYKKMKDQEIDLIIISSFIYEREIHSKIMEISPNALVWTFYEKSNGDVFSDYEVFLEYC